MKTEKIKKIYYFYFSPRRQKNYKKEKICLLSFLVYFLTKTKAEPFFPKKDGSALL